MLEKFTKYIEIKFINHLHVCILDELIKAYKIPDLLRFQLIQISKFDFNPFSKSDN